MNNTIALLSSSWSSHFILHCFMFVAFTSFMDDSNRNRSTQYNVDAYKSLMWFIATVSWSNDQTSVAASNTFKQISWSTMKLSQEMEMIRKIHFKNFDMAKTTPKCKQTSTTTNFLGFSIQHLLTVSSIDTCCLTPSQQITLCSNTPFE